MMTTFLPCPRCGARYRADRGFPCCWACSQAQRAREAACLYCGQWRPSQFSTCARHREADDAAATEAHTVRQRQHWACLACGRVVSPLHVGHLASPPPVDAGAAVRRGRQVYLAPPQPWILAALCGECCAKPLDNAALLVGQVRRYAGALHGELDGAQQAALLALCQPYGVPLREGSVIGLVGALAGACGRCGKATRRYGLEGRQTASHAGPGQGDQPGVRGRQTGSQAASRASQGGGGRRARRALESPLCSPCRGGRETGLERLLRSPRGAARWGEPVTLPLGEEDWRDILECVEDWRTG